MDARTAREAADRLSTRLVNRRSQLKVWDDYYRGKTPRPYVPADRAQEYQSLLDRAKANMMKSVVDMVAERLKILGVTSAQGDLADRLWDVWQVSGMDARQARLWRTALKTGVGYLTVVRRSDGQIVLRTASPMRTIHEVDPAEPERVTLAATFWGEEQPGDLKGDAPATFCRLFVPGEWIDLKRAGARWRIVTSGEVAPGLVSVRPVLNLPDDEGGFASELDGLTEIQDRINQTIADRLMAQTFAAHRQRLIMGWTPDEDENGNPIWPFKPGVNRTWTIEDKDVKAMEFAATDLNPYLMAQQTDQKTLAVTSRRPAPYLLGGENPPSADALQSAEKSGMSAVVGDRKADFGEDIEAGLNMAAVAMGMPADDRLEVVWADLEPHSEGMRVDAAVKKSGLMIPFEQIWRELGYSPQQISDFPTMISAFSQAIGQQPPTQ